MKEVYIIELIDFVAGTPKIWIEDTSSSESERSHSTQNLKESASAQALINTILSSPRAGAQTTVCNCLKHV